MEEGAVLKGGRMLLLLLPLLLLLLVPAEIAVEEVEEVDASWTMVSDSCAHLRRER